MSIFEFVGLALIILLSAAGGYSYAKRSAKVAPEIDLELPAVVTDSPTASERFPLPPAPSTARSEMQDAQDRVEYLLGHPLVKGNYGLEHVFNSVGRVEILDALLVAEGPLSRSELGVLISSTQFHNHMVRLRNTGLVISTGEAKGMKYALNPDRADLVADILLASKAVAA